MPWKKKIWRPTPFARRVMAAPSQKADTSKVFAVAVLAVVAVNPSPESNLED